MAAERKDNRNRPLVKVRLNDNPEAWGAMSILAKWRKRRGAAANLARAIALYDALLEGETGRLFEFPFLRDALAASGYNTTAPRRERLPGGIPDAAGIEIEYREKSSDEDADDLLGGFF